MRGAVTARTGGARPDDGLARATPGRAIFCDAPSAAAHNCSRNRARREIL